MSEQIQSKIRTLIEDSQVEEALTAFYDVAAYSRELKKVLDTIQSDYLRYQRDKVSKRYTDSTNDLQITIISSRILDLLDQWTTGRFLEVVLDEKISTNPKLLKKLEEKLRAPYHNIYEWHKDQGKQNFLDSFGPEVAFSTWGSKYAEFIRSMRPPRNASFSDMIAIAEGVIDGCLGWSAKEKTEPNVYIDAFKILYLAQNATVETMKDVDDFLQKASHIAAVKNDSLFKIKNKIPPYENLGGLTSFLTLNKCIDHRYVYTPFFFDLEEAESEYDLVVQIKKGNVRISNLSFDYSDIDLYGWVKLSLLAQVLDPNISSEKIKISKGQLFESLNTNLKYQVLASRHEASPVHDNDTEASLDPNRIRFKLTLFPLCSKLLHIESEQALISCFHLPAQVNSEVDYRNRVNSLLESQPKPVDLPITLVPIRPVPDPSRPFNPEHNAEIENIATGTITILGIVFLIYLFWPTLVSLFQNFKF